MKHITGDKHDSKSRSRPGPFHIGLDILITVLARHKF